MYVTRTHGDVGGGALRDAPLSRLNEPERVSPPLRVPSILNTLPGDRVAKTVAQKARVKPGTTIAVLNPVPGVMESLGLPADARFVEPSDAQLVFLFVSGTTSGRLPRGRA